MAQGTFNWVEFEASLLAELRFALEQTGIANPEAKFFAVALYHVDREGELLSLPLLAACAEPGPESSSTEGFWSDRWNPHGWTHTEIDLREQAALNLETALTDEATRKTEAHFAKVEARYFRVLVSLAKALRDRAPELLGVTRDFVCFVHDTAGGVDLARKTIPRETFARLFEADVKHQAELASVERQLPDERAAFLVTRLGRSPFDGVGSEEAAKLLLQIGDGAVPHLLPVLSRKEGWLAAKFLGQIGNRSPEVIDALRRATKQGFWPAMALGVLGDLQWLSAQRPSVAVPGLCGPLRAVTGTVVARDYRPLEAYLTAADPATIALVEKELEPGSGYADASTDDIDELLRAVKSEHPVVRWHAAATLCPLHLGKRTRGKEITQALAAAFDDPHAAVRRIAVLSLRDWKAAASPHMERIRKLRETDPDESVRRAAGLG